MTDCHFYIFKLILAVVSIVETNYLYQLNQLSRDIEGVQILKGISLKILSGEFLALLGPSGSGKTSLLRLFNSLDSPTAGILDYRGKSIEDWDIRLLRQQVGMVFQEPVVVAGSVHDNLTICQRWEKPIKPLSDLDLLATLDKVGLKSIDMHMDARSLSGGEKQRLALARVLLNQPQVLLLDEPTASLDHTLAHRIIRRVAELHREMNLTCIMVSHDPTLVRRFAERVVFLHEGQIAEDGPVTILDRPTSAQLQTYLAEER